MTGQRDAADFQTVGTVARIYVFAVGAVAAAYFLLEVSNLLGAF
jgi:hypothetical protein